jgi:hypothetical protein
MAGKGDKERPRSVTREEYERRWKLAFEEGGDTDEEKPKGPRKRTGSS